MIRRLTLIVFLLVCTAPAPAEEALCKDALPQARDYFTVGQFDEVVSLLKTCTEGRMAARDKKEMLSLRARAYFYLDRIDEARKEIAHLLRLDPNFDDEPKEFSAIVARVRAETQTAEVGSVSKTPESLREAPATVVVVTAEEIERRGYLDLEQLLHDLPGFDISRLNGDIYSYIYQRGYRSQNDRLLLLVDGIEQNELSSSILYLSRQYSLTNIDRVEVIYGPASTMYGANAYTGVINIITKSPQALTGDSHEYGGLGNVTVGGYGSGYADVTVAGTSASGSRAWSVSLSYQRSEERDLSRLEPWDYSFGNFDYASWMRLAGGSASSFIQAGHCAQPSPYYRCVNSTTSPVVELTPTGVDLVRSLDRRLITSQSLGFDDRAQNWSLHSKVRFSNITLGVQTWRSQESRASQYGADDLGIFYESGNGERSPHFAAFYAKYSLPLDRGTLSVFTRYLQTGFVNNRSHVENLHTYNAGFLNMWSLVAPCQAPLDTQPVTCAPADAWVETVTEDTHSNRLHSEVTVTHEASSKLNGVAGFEIGRSSIQDQINHTASGPGELYYTKLRDPEQIEHTDVAAYVQGTYKPTEALRLVLAGRFSYNEINYKAGASGYGTLVTPRAGIIYSLLDHTLTLKAIYSEAFKDPNDTQKFGVMRYANEVPSAGLKPERARNVELSAGWTPTSRVSLDGALYRAHYTDVVSGGSAPGCTSDDGCLQWQNRDDLRIAGFQGTARYVTPVAEIWGNYTHTRPYLYNPLNLDRSPLLDSDGNRVRSLRIADIASHRWNLGVDTQWRKRWKANVRFHFIGDRRTAAGTTDIHPSGYANPFPVTGSRFTTDATVSYSGLLPNMTLQLIAFNLFDKQYYDPNLSIVVGTPRVLQAGRTVYFRLGYTLPRIGR